MSERVSRETLDLIHHFVDVIIEESKRQNLIAASTLSQIWQRHILDSVQLITMAPDPGFSWIDVGTGAGFPGIVAAIVTQTPTILIESRRLRAAFLCRAVEELALTNVDVRVARAEAVTAPPAGILTARAVAPLPKLLAAMHHLSDCDTLWLLPKGRSAASELAEARRTWQGDFVMQPSITDPDAAIIVARNVMPRKGRGR